MLEELLKPKINWKVLLRRFMQSLANFDYTWRKPRRRMLPLGIYMPSVYSEGLSKVTFAIDTSGSITEKQFNQFMSEVYAVMKQFSPNIIDVMQFDINYRHMILLSHCVIYNTLSLKVMVVLNLM